MSYILDALKKSEEERRKLEEKQHNPYTSVAGRKIPRHGKTIVPAAIISSFLLLTALILGSGWWFTNRPPVEEKVIASDNGSEEAAVAPAVQKEMTQQTLPVEPGIVENQSAVLPAAAVSRESLAGPEPRSRGGLPDKIPILDELPFSTRSMLPEMQFRGHVYSPLPNQRMIMINSTVVREGDPVAPELIVSEITETGLIMKFRETVFQVNLF